MAKPLDAYCCLTDDEWKARLLYLTNKTIPLKKQEVTKPERLGSGPLQIIMGNVL